MIVRVFDMEELSEGQFGQESKLRIKNHEGGLGRQLERKLEIRKCLKGVQALKGM